MLPFFFYYRLQKKETGSYHFFFFLFSAQPPGVPEICKKSLTSCPVTGGAELFVLGKNFLKDTKVIFQQPDVHPPWEETVLPDKEFLQQVKMTETWNKNFNFYSFAR